MQPIDRKTAMESTVQVQGLQSNVKCLDAPIPMKTLVDQDDLFT